MCPVRIPGDSPALLPATAVVVQGCSTSPLLHFPFLHLLPLCCAYLGGAAQASDALVTRVCRIVWQMGFLLSCFGASTQPHHEKAGHIGQEKEVATAADSDRAQERGTANSDARASGSTTSVTDRSSNLFHSNTLKPFRSSAQPQISSGDPFFITLTKSSELSERPPSLQTTHTVSSRTSDMHTKSGLDNRGGGSHDVILCGPGDLIAGIHRPQQWTGVPAACRCLLPSTSAYSLPCPADCESLSCLGQGAYSTVYKGK